MDELIRVSKEVLSYLNSQRGMLVGDYAYDLAKAISVAERELRANPNTDEEKSDTVAILLTTGERNGGFSAVLGSLPEEGK